LVSEIIVEVLSACPYQSPRRSNETIDAGSKGAADVGSNSSYSDANNLRIW
jgi:hypothetical protein